MQQTVPVRTALRRFLWAAEALAESVPADRHARGTDALNALDALPPDLHGVAGELLEQARRVADVLDRSPRAIQNRAIQAGRLTSAHFGMFDPKYLDWWAYRWMWRDDEYKRLRAELEAAADRLQLDPGGKAPGAGAGLGAEAITSHPGMPAAGEFAGLDASADALGLTKGALRIVKELSKRDGRVPLADLATLLNWSTPYDNAWNSARVRLNKKLGKKGWKLVTIDRNAVAKQTPAPAGRSPERSKVVRKER